MEREEEGGDKAEPLRNPALDLATFGTHVVGLGLPIIVSMGTAYLLGYFSNISLLYFTYLDFQDFIVSAIAFLPIFIVAHAILLLILEFSPYKEGDRAILKHTPEEKREETQQKLEKTKSDPLGYFRDKNTKSWRDERVIAMKVYWVFAAVIFFALFCLLMAGVTIPWWIMWPVVLAFSAISQMLLVYFWERYDDPFDVRLALGLILSLYIFAVGFTASKIDLASHQPKYHVTMVDGADIDASIIRRVGNNSLLLGSETREWQLIPREQIVSVERRRFKRSAPAGHET
ncbi:hypothetical protein [Hyphomonas sp.]|uniref:hypothetical protein n=1 Tax=Hyphomonas sp. TaxID=87 RepID=UPI0032EECF6E